jgi:hypothetical protein
MHGILLDKETPTFLKDALPLLSLNSVTLLGAEVFGRGYGGGILKMEPREAASLPIPDLESSESAWSRIAPKRTSLDQMLIRGKWQDAIQIIDRVLLEGVLGMASSEVRSLKMSGASLRKRRTRDAR